MLGLRDFWERLGPRERRLGGFLGVVLVVCLLGYAAFSINDGLGAMQQKNEDTRALLANLEAHRDELAVDHGGTKGDAVGLIGDEAAPLSTYLEKIGTEAGVTIKNQTDRPVVIKGKFQEVATNIILFDLNVDQMARFLRGIETGSPIVVTRHLVVKRASLTKEKLERVEVTVATYQRNKTAAPAAAKPEEAKQ
jgi:hypothetical protein